MFEIFISIRVLCLFLDSYGSFYCSLHIQYISKKSFDKNDYSKGQKKKKETIQDQLQTIIVYCSNKKCSL